MFNCVYQCLVNTGQFEAAYFKKSLKLCFTNYLISAKKTIFGSPKYPPMKTQPISEMSTENLKKNYKAMKLVTGILTGCFIVMVGSALYIGFTKGFGTTTTILPLVFVPLFISNIINLKKIKKELVARGEEKE